MRDLAPIAYQGQNVAQEDVYIGLGSNLGDRRCNLNNAIEQLKLYVIIEQIAAFYETEPLYVTSQPCFYNTILRGRTALKPRELLLAVKGIETRMGRAVTQRYGPRIIDIDILLFGAIHIEEPDLIIPHPFITERAFVLIPLAEIAPDLIVPGQKQTVASLAQQFESKDMIVRVLESFRV